MHRIFRVKAYEKEHGPHFNEEYARKAVMKMENEDGTRGPHWSLEETTTLASQYGIALGSKFNRYDWFVALNMVYSDYYRVIMNITGSNNTKHYVEFAKAWLNDKDIDEGKMWYYYIQEIINIIRNQYNMYKQRKESIAKCDEEMAKCQQLLDKLDTHNETTNESLKIVELQNEINELKSIIRKANQMVPPPMKEMLPQDMKDVMNKVDQ